MAVLVVVEVAARAVRVRCPDEGRVSANIFDAMEVGGATALCN